MSALEAPLPQPPPDTAAEISAPRPVEVEGPLFGRFLGQLIDMAALFVFWLLFGIFFDDPAAIIAAVALYLVLSSALWRKGQSIGKRAVDLRCVHAETKASFGRMAFRETVCQLVLPALSFGLWFVVESVMGILDPRRRTLSDRLARTVVVNDPEGVFLPEHREVIAVAVSEPYVPEGETARVVLEVRDLVKHFPVSGGGLFSGTTAFVQAVSGVSFQLRAGRTLGLVGESGSGKSTVGRTLLRLTEPTAGSISFDGNLLTRMNQRALRQFRGQMQIVFQDPYASLDPRMTVSAIIKEPLKIHSVPGDHDAKVAELLELVGLNPEHKTRFPHEFSGGQRQRVGIARALALEPAVLILDEPVSALDVSIQAGVVNLLEALQDRLGLAYLFIAHDLSVVRHISDEIAVMYLGKIVEIGTRKQVYETPGHPYTQALLSAIPTPDPTKERARKRIVLEGEVPSPINPPSGCRFRTRCWKAQDICAEVEPALEDRGQAHPVACHFADVVEVV